MYQIGYTSPIYAVSFYPSAGRPYRTAIRVLASAVSVCPSVRDAYLVRTITLARINAPSPNAHQIEATITVGGTMLYNNTIYMTRERMVQQKVDRSGPVLFSRMRPTIQYRASTEWRSGGERGVSSQSRFGLYQVTCSLLVAATATAAAAAFVNGYSAD